ncbi:unnamed protein product, partial [Hymenolepis diminuta]
FYGERRYHRDGPIKDVGARVATKIPLLRIFYEQFNLNSERALTQTWQSYSTLTQVLCDSTYQCDAKLHTRRRRSSRSATLQIKISIP